MAWAKAKRPDLRGGRPTTSIYRRNRQRPHPRRGRVGPRLHGRGTGKRHAGRRRGRRPTSSGGGDGATTSSSRRRRLATRSRTAAARTRIPSRTRLPENAVGTTSRGPVAEGKVPIEGTGTALTTRSSATALGNLLGRPEAAYRPRIPSPSGGDDTVRTAPATGKRTGSTATPGTTGLLGGDGDDRMDACRRADSSTPARATTSVDTWHRLGRVRRTSSSVAGGNDILLCGRGRATVSSSAWATGRTG